MTDDKRITPGDIEAMLYVLDAFIEDADSLSLEDSVGFRKMLEEVQAKAKVAAGLCKTQTLQLLDGAPRQIGDTIFAAKSTGKWRPNHDRIKSRVALMACSDPTTGEVLEAEAAARQAVDFTYKLFVSPSMAPKQEGLKALKLGNPDVCDWQDTGKELVEVSVQGGPPE